MAENEPTDLSIDLAALEKLPVSADPKNPVGLGQCPKTCGLTCIGTCDGKTLGVIEPLPV